MSNMNNPLSSISYTNKDFQTIYPELLEAAKMLAKNWDPTISNESDPGVVLLKLCAIVGDKNNYNIDKNVLENYPETYTQEISARSQYRQLGYKMPWYRAATMPVNFRWVGEALEVGQYVVIPKYTLLTDVNSELAFTLLEDVRISKSEDSASLIGSGKVMQGVINNLMITGTTVLTLSHLDSNNRLYINDSTIAENGIFVYSADTGEQWTQVYNVDTQHPNSRCYEFDVDQIQGCPYIQFPSDIYSTIGGGIKVEYITTNGYSGNVAANTVNSYLNESTVTIKSVNLAMETKDVPLNTSNITVWNTYSTSEILADLDINMGKDPETIEEARISYKKLAGTFETLVTLRDYMNAIYSMNPELVSNVIVTDRTNDIQSSYKIITKYPSIFNVITYMTEGNKYVFKPGDKGEQFTRNGDGSFSKVAGGATVDNPYYLDIDESRDMSPFDLRLYLLKSNGVLSTIDSYDGTFLVDNTSTTQMRIEAKLSELKSIQHDFVGIKPDLPFMLQNVYPIKLKIIPSHKLDELQQDNVKFNIQRALMNLLNSRKCEFGVEPDYDIIYNTIASCDERIKIIIMDDFVYTTFAVYLDNSGETPEFKYIPISDYGTCDRAIVVAGDEDDDEEDIKDKLLSKLRAIDIKALDVAEAALKDYMFIDSKNGILYKVELEEQTDANGTKIDSIRNLYEYSDKLQEIRKQVIAKNVLAGVTPLYEIADDVFTTTIDMQQAGASDVYNISTELEIHPFGIDEPYKDSKRSAVYTLKSNESVRCLAPSFIMDKSYSSYTKYEVTLASPLSSSTNFTVAYPADRDDLISTYGYSMFYKRTDKGYEPVVSDAYLQLVTEPKYKIDSYYIKQNSGNGIEYSIIRRPNSTRVEVDNVLTEASATAFELEFEPYLYYKKVGGVYEVLTSYPTGEEPNQNWGKEYYSNCYKLRQYVSGPAYMTVEDFIAGWLSKTKDDLQRELGSRNIYKREESTHNLVTNVDWDDVQKSISGESYGEDTPPVYCVDAAAELSSVDSALTMRNNIDESYIQLGQYGSNVYRVIKNTTGTVVGYEMVMLTEPAEGVFALLNDTVTNGEYIKVTQPDVWSSSNYSIRYFSNSPVVTVSDGLKFSSIKNIPTIPASGSAYKYDVSSTTYIQVDPIASEWKDEYQDYYVRTSGFNGLHPSSQEYANWLDNRLTLYVPELTYKLEAETEYQLRSGDSVKFFWRDKEGADAEYNYECYKGTTDEYSNPIIKANFAIRARRPSDEIISTAKLNSGTDSYSSGTIPYDGTPGSDFDRIYNMYGDDDLGTSRQIDIRKINQVRMIKDGECKNRYYYVVTNNKIKPTTGEYAGQDCYKLSLPCVNEKYDSDTGTYTYRYKHALQSDEYFFYVNENKTLYGVLGEGTLIDYTMSSSTPIEGNLDLIVKAVNTFDISFRGISIFKEHCKEITTADDIRLIEQQVYAFTEGDKLQFELKHNNREKYVKVNAAKHEYSADEEYYNNTFEYKPVVLITVNTVERSAPPFIVNYYYEKSDTSDEYTKLGTIPPDWGTKYTSQDGTVSFGCCKYYYLAGSKFDKVDDVTASNYTNYYIKETPSYPVISTSNPLLLSDVDVYYSTPSAGSAGTFSKLPAIDVVDEEYKWSVTSYFNISTNSTHPQVIPHPDTNNQSRCSITVGNMSYPDVPDGSNIDPTKDLYIMTDIPVEKTGGNNIDISWTSLLGEIQSVKVLSYQINGSISEDQRFEKLLDTDEIVFNVEAASDTEWKEINITDISLDTTCKHILPIEVVTDDIDIEVYIDTDSEPVNCMCCGLPVMSGLARTDKPEKHFISLDSDTQSLKIRYRNRSTTNTSAIRFHKIFKYKERELFGGGVHANFKYGLSTEDIEEEIRLLDIPKEFDYCYVPSVDVRIDDPLDPKSIFDGNHVFNKFSIPKAELQTVKPFSSSIEFVNNR